MSSIAPIANLDTILVIPLLPPNTWPSIILTISLKVKCSISLRLRFSIRTVPTRSIVATMPILSASLIARYAVPSDTFKNLAILRTEILEPIDNDSI
ncbi:Uncharacterised protein [Staphylococcus aureus]|nr:Uncharacterised protein [Staphylococcus aureus]